VVVIPPAWGKTKETALPLAATILSTFREAGQSVRVLRFDGIRRRGESHNDAICARPGYENVNYTFSQGANDILATIEYLYSKPNLRPSTVILVTFSIASIEARRAIVLDSGNRIGGWVSLVGAPDLQSLIRKISGGVDYLGGVERGFRFGLQGVQGLLLDIDQAAADAIENRLGFLEDARCDMSNITVPVTWICGRYDAWMDRNRVQDILSMGNNGQRRMIEVPTGHELRSSRQAREIFRVVSAEVARRALGKRLRAVGAEPNALIVRQRAERSRVKRPSINVARFWREYLVGRNADFGVDLIANTDIYRGFMRQQIMALNPKRGEVVADLGAGVGVFSRELDRSGLLEGEVKVIQVDLVKEALAQTKTRDSLKKKDRIELTSIVADLEVSEPAISIPLERGTLDAAIASLLINYVVNVDALLKEIIRLLRPGGRLVVSSLREDADISMICVNGVRELRMGRGREAFGELEGEADKSLSEFISNAAQLVNLEEQGRFRFWSMSELKQMLRRSGFSGISISQGFGSPPQAYIATAERSRENTKQ
jgi:ubiquinone/menaquinone biosynthesis C-methylase UbiE/pimeloyl-ACP methyl ester carboxylesterase